MYVCFFVFSQYFGDAFICWVSYFLIHGSSYYNLREVCLFVCVSVCSSTPPRFLVRSPSNLVGGCRFTGRLPLRGSFLERSRLKVKVTGVKGPNNGPISIKLGGWMQGRVTGLKVKVTGSKVHDKVTGVKGQIIVRSPSNLVGWCRDGSRGQRSRSFLERSRSMGING